MSLQQDKPFKVCFPAGFISTALLFELLDFKYFCRAEVLCSPLYKNYPFLHYSLFVCCLLFAVCFFIPAETDHTSKIYKLRR